MGERQGELDEHLRRAGVDSRRLRHALHLLSSGRWWTLGDLVRETATSRRAIEELLRTLDLERDGERFRTRHDLAGRARGPALADPVAHLVDAEVVARMAELIGRAPRPRSELDHVAATADTAVRRALLLGSRFHLPGGRVLCLGDHDLTSVALSLLHPEAEIMVADVDDRILEYISSAAPEVRCRWADFRIGLPPSAEGWADLVLTDPPYSVDGVGLFISRGLAGLRDLTAGRIALAYGVGEGVPALAHKVQGEVHRLGLVIEAMWPDFNVYRGAEAIGSAADLYLLRPTRKSLREPTGRRQIYTRGPASVESSPSAPPEDLVRRAAADARILVGDWPGDIAPGLPRARFSTWLSRPHPTAPDDVAVSITGRFPGLLPRVLLATRAARVRAVVPAPAEPAPAPIGEVYDVATERSGDWLLVTAVRLAPPVGSAVRRVFDSAHGKPANALARESRMTKNGAREFIADHAPWTRDASPLELPLHRLRELAEIICSWDRRSS